jgi:tetratricopeptide (TPR) repeat protein
VPDRHRFEFPVSAKTALPPTDYDAAVTSAIILHEVPEQFALHVSRALRLTHAWAAGPEASGTLFDVQDLEEWEADVLRSSGIDEALWAPVAVIAGELARPAEVDPERLVHACLAVTDWGLGCEANGTAVMFAEAAAAVWPNNARIAWIAGRIHRDRGHFSRAQSWLEHTSRVAVASGDWELHAQAINSLGNLKVHLGDLAGARDLLLAAARVAKRKKLRERHAMVLHDLFVVCTYAGQFDQADVHAQQAFAAYGPDHPNAVNLAYDVSHLCTLQGQFARALQVLEPLRGRFADPDRRLRVLAGIARAAGEAGNAEPFHEAWVQAWSIMESGSVNHLRPAAALELGLGALALGIRAQAEVALTVARDSARMAREGDTLSRAESALSELGQPRRRAGRSPALARSRAADLAKRVAQSPDAPERIAAEAN